MLLHTLTAGAAQNGQELVIGDEEEPGEGIPLSVQVVVQRLLAVLKSLAQSLQVLQTVLGVAGHLDDRRLVRLHHYLYVDHANGASVGELRRWR